MSDQQNPKQQNAGQQAARKRRQPRKATRKSLENAALHYLQRYASSAENLRRVLMRRVQRSAAFHDTNPDEGAGFVDEILTRYRETGLVNDAVYAEGRVRSLHRRGLSGRAISMRLKQKGVGDEDISAALETLAEDGVEVELQAAANLARRRRLGPWRTREIKGEDEQRARRDKDIAALARSGFSLDIARTIIDAESIEEIEDRLAGVQD